MKNVAGRPRNVVGVCSRGFNAPLLTRFYFPALITTSSKTKHRSYLSIGAVKGGIITADPVIEVFYKSFLYCGTERVSSLDDIFQTQRKGERDKFPEMLHKRFYLSITPWVACWSLHESLLAASARNMHVNPAASKSGQYKQTGRQIVTLYPDATVSSFAFRPRTPKTRAAHVLHTVMRRRGRPPGAPCSASVAAPRRHWSLGLALSWPAHYEGFCTLTQLPRVFYH